MKKNYDFKKGKRGAVVPVPAGKSRITIRIDDDVLDWFRKQVHDAGGGSYQTQMNQALREHMEHEAEPLEETFRRVLKEVLPASRQKKAPSKKKRPSVKKTARRKAT